MGVTTDRQDDVQCVAVAGRLDGPNSAGFEDALRNAMSDDDRAVIVDLENLSYISSARLRAVLVMAKQLSERSMKFALCSLSGLVREVFEVSGFDKSIAVHATREAAVAFVDD